MEVKQWFMHARVPLGMLVVQIINTGMLLLSRVILNKGASVFAVMTYRHILAAMCIAPFALYFERGVVRKLNFAVFLWIFMVASIGVSMAIGLLYYGLNDTTAAYATNFMTLVPLITFFFSTVLRIERLGLHSRAGKMKIVGAMVCLGGALVVCLYKGSSFHITHNKIIDKTKQNKIRGTLFLVGSCLSYGMWYILQAKLFKVFPYKYWATMLTCSISSVQTVITGLCMDKKPKAWHLGWDLNLVTISYSGILTSAVGFCLISWSVTQRGPTYPAMFTPLFLIFVTISEALILGEAITEGSLIGMALIIVGLYSFLWGKNKDGQRNTPLPLTSETGDAGSGDGSREVDGAQSPPEPVLRSSASLRIVPIASHNGDETNITPYELNSLHNIRK